ncbi:MAG: hypothetical protein LBO72_04810 [Helicobacteraceae bacterium]|jgi:membrane-anchored glycerophosphoryl diester phosphodiesterase (GDPDase)|nr:hypothetical protein [Helicobacteraceae bacterium]
MKAVLLTGWLISVILTCLGIVEPRSAAAIIGVPLLVIVWVTQFVKCGSANPFYLFRG